MSRIPKVLIIGLDGGTFDLIRPWVDEGKLPNIARVMQSGANGKLRSTIPPMTFPAWNAFMTGKNPGKHGVFDFMERKDGTYELEIKNAGHRKSETIWKIASRHGKRCAVIGVPVTYPPEKINGVMISGFDAPVLDERIMYPREVFHELEDKVGQYIVPVTYPPEKINGVMISGFDAPVLDEGIMYPREIFHELKDKVGQYIVSADFTKHLRAGRIDDTVKSFFVAIDRKAETAKYILKREAWDLFMIVFGETDAAIHYFWKYHDRHSPQRSEKPGKNPSFDPIYEIYNRVDKRIGEILEMVSGETVVIMMSDHGAGGAGDKVIYLNRFLESRGLLRFKNLPLITYFNKKMDKLKASVRTLLPKKLLKHLRFNPKGMGLKWESKLRFSSIDWQNTKVYAEETPYYPNLRVNLAGREPDGIVQEGEYRELLVRTISLLKEWTDPETGGRVVNEAYIREDLYNGDYTGSAPDIIISWNLDSGYSYLYRPSFLSKKGLLIERMSAKEVEMSDYMFNRSGSHRDEGIFIISGKAIKATASVDNARILDLAPTILHLLDIPIPGDMDGRVLLECFKEDYIRTPAFDSVSISKTKSDYHYSDEETDEIKKKLEGLGYL